MIFYALLCRIDGTILVEGTPNEIEGNYPQISQSLVDFLKEKPVDLDWESEPSPEEPTIQCELYDGARRTFVNSNEENGYFCGMSNVLNYGFGANQDDFNENENVHQKYYFHVGREGNLIFVCLADDMSGIRHRVNFAFLEEIHGIFISRYSKSKIDKAISYEMEKSFAHIMRSTIHTYNTDPNAGSSHSVAALHAQIEDLKNVMGKNIFIMLQRGANIEALANKAQLLSEEATVFSKRSAKVKGKMMRKSVKYQLCIGVTIIILIYIVGASFCGMYFERCIDWHRP